MTAFPRLLLITLSLLLTVPATAADEAEDEDNGLKYRLLGPANGGRASRVVGIPGDPQIYYVATAAGGVWKSSNGGTSWESVFDDQPVSSIGSVALAPGNPNTVFVGSGEANMRGNVAEGNGIYRSRDAGKTWKHVWKSEGQIGTIVVHPTNDDVIFAAVLGSPFGPGNKRGVYRSKDGGDNWERVLYVNVDSGASDIAFDEKNPNILFAGTWQARRKPWDMLSGGPGSGLYISRDGGSSWDKLESGGLPEGIWGKVGVRVAPTNSNRVYALIEAKDGGLFRSDDGGDNWTHISDSAGLKQRAWYYSTLTIDPNNENIVWFPQVSMQKTMDGGKTVRSVKAGGWDHHDVWIDPKNSNRMAEASDAGVSVSMDGGKTWLWGDLPIGQFYHLAVDTRTPYRVMGSLQDFGTRAAPNNSLHGGGLLPGDWVPVGGGEAGFVAPDPDDPDIVYAGEYLGYLSRYNERTGQAPHVGIYPDNGSGHGAVDLRHRFQWTAPIVISPHDSKLVYHASNFLQRTRDAGQTWEIISPDLTRNDKTKQQWAGGPITGDNTGVEFYGTIFAVAESPVTKGVIWTGSDDGLVHVSRDDGKNWTAVTPRGAPEWATVGNIEASRFDAGTAYVVFDAHRLDDETPYAYKTINYGQSWTAITSGLDKEIYLKVIREDSQKKGLLYLGSERGVLVSEDDGGSWESLRLNMPTVAIADLAVTRDDLVVGTLGRSAWVLHDLTPLREMSDRIAASPAHLFKPLDPIRWTYGPSPDGGRSGSTSNPDEGMTFTYHLATEPEDDITAVILDAGGKVVRTLSSKAEPLFIPEDHPDARPDSKEKSDLTRNKGMNRASWNLTHQGATRIPESTNDAGNMNVGPMVLPGPYTLRLTVAGKNYEQPFTVLPDPRSDAKPAELALQVNFLLAVRDRISLMASDVIRIRSVREQIEAHQARLADDPRAARLNALGTELSAAMREVELAVYNPDAEVNYDILAGRHGGAKLYSRFGWLYRTSMDHSGPPTQGMTEVNTELSALQDEARKKLDRIFNEDLKQLNALAGELGIAYITVVE